LEKEEALEAEISVLASSFEKLIRGCSSQSCSEKPCQEMVMLELQLREKDTIIANIRSQLSKAQNERDQQELANVNLIARHQEELLPEMKQVTLLKSDKEILEQRCKGLKAELKKVNAAKENMKRRV
jgi:broad-specificity NMP kinase